MLIPDRIAGLALVSTAAQIRSTVPFWQHLWQRAMMFVPRPLDHVLASIRGNLYTDGFAFAEDEQEPIVERFPTNGDRMMAVELRKRLDPRVYPR